MKSNSLLHLINITNIYNDNKQTKPKQNQPLSNLNQARSKENLVRNITGSQQYGNMNSSENFKENKTKSQALNQKDKHIQIQKKSSYSNIHQSSGIQSQYQPSEKYDRGIDIKISAMGKENQEENTVQAPISYYSIQNQSSNRPESQQYEQKFQTVESQFVYGNQQNHQQNNQQMNRFKQPCYTSPKNNNPIAQSLSLEKINPNYEMIINGQGGINNALNTENYSIQKRNSQTPSIQQYNSHQAQNQQPHMLAPYSQEQMKINRLVDKKKSVQHQNDAKYQNSKAVKKEIQKQIKPILGSHKKSNSLVNQKIVDIISGLQQSLAITGNTKKSYSTEELNQLVMNSIIQSQGNNKNAIEQALLAQKLVSVSSNVSGQGKGDEGQKQISVNMSQDGLQQILKQNMRKLSEGRQEKLGKQKSRFSGGFKTIDEASEGRLHNTSSVTNRMSFEAVNSRSSAGHGHQRTKSDMQGNRKVDSMSGQTLSQPNENANLLQSYASKQSNGLSMFGTTIENNVQGQGGIVKKHSNSQVTMEDLYNGKMSFGNGSNHPIATILNSQFPISTKNKKAVEKMTTQHQKNKLKKKLASTKQNSINQRSSISSKQKLSQERVSDANFIANISKKCSNLFNNNFSINENKLKSAASSPSLHVQIKQNQMQMGNKQKSGISNDNDYNYQPLQNQQKVIKKKNQRSDKSSSQQNVNSMSIHRRSISDSTSLTKMFHFKQQMMINKFLSKGIHSSNTQQNSIQDPSNIVQGKTDSQINSDMSKNMLLSNLSSKRSSNDEFQNFNSPRSNIQKPNPTKMPQEVYGEMAHLISKLQDRPVNQSHDPNVVPHVNLHLQNLQGFQKNNQIIQQVQLQNYVGQAKPNQNNSQVQNQVKNKSSMYNNPNHPNQNSKQKLKRKSNNFFNQKVDKIDKDYQLEKQDKGTKSSQLIESKKVASKQSGLDFMKFIKQQDVKEYQDNQNRIKKDSSATSSNRKLLSQLESVSPVNYSARASPIGQKEFYHEGHMKMGGIIGNLKSNRSEKCINNYNSNSQQQSGNPLINFIQGQNLNFMNINNAKNISSQNKSSTERDNSGSNQYGRKLKNSTSQQSGINENETPQFNYNILGSVNEKKRQTESRILQVQKNVIDYYEVAQTSRPEKYQRKKNNQSVSSNKILTQNGKSEKDRLDSYGKRKNSKSKKDEKNGGNSKIGKKGKDLKLILDEDDYNVSGKVSEKKVGGQYGFIPQSSKNKNSQKGIFSCSSPKFHILPTPKAIQPGQTSENPDQNTSKLIIENQGNGTDRLNLQVPMSLLKQTITSEEGKSSERVETVESNLTDIVNLSPESQVKHRLKKAIQKNFKKFGAPLKTSADFYKIGKMLGKGAFGRVNLAMHKLCSQLVAVKSINKQFLSEDENSKKKVMQEVQILQKTRHPAIVKLYDSFETNKHIVFVMELCAGGDLLNYVRKRRKLKEDLAKILFREVVSGLQYCHSKGIVHRDIKLDNLLLNQDGNVKICDFGVSRVLADGNEVMNEQCGTPAYIAPEILKDKGYKGFGVDIWSLGVCLYAMLYGTVPFKANNMNDLNSLILKAKYSLKDDKVEISDDAKNLIKLLLEPDPKKRINITQVKKNKWLETPDEQGVEIFSEAEKKGIEKDFTYQDMKRYNRNQPRHRSPNQSHQINQSTENFFTEHALDSTQNALLRNNSTKSIILAPFNSTRSHLDNMKDENGDSILKPLEFDQDMLADRKCIKFAARVKDIDRQYEINNNCEVDNGVYNKFVKQTNQDNSTDSIIKSMAASVKSNSLLNSVNQPQLDKQRIQAPLVSQNSDDEGDDDAFKQHQPGEQSQDFKQYLIPYQSQITFQEEEELIINYDIVERIEDFGYPKAFLIKSLDNFEMNDATTAYFLLERQMQQGLPSYDYSNQFQEELLGSELKRKNPDQNETTKQID